MSKEIWREEYPFESHWLDLDGHRYHYIDEGEGSPILFVHGNPTWSFAFRKFVSGLSDQYRCIGVDHIGCGLSDKPLEYEYRLATHIDNLCRLIEDLNLDHISLVAHDWGGAIGMGAAVRMSARFSRIGLMNTAAFSSDFIPKRIAVCRIPYLGALGVRGLNGFARAAISQAVVNKKCWTKAAKAGYLAPYDSWNHRIAVHRFVQDIPMKPSHPSYQTLQDIADHLDLFNDCPIKLIWGMQDWCFHPGFLHRFQEIWPHAETVELENSGHYLFEDEPEKCVYEVKTLVQDRM
jgi:haloalkane dehalogenase